MAEALTVTHEQLVALVAKVRRAERERLHRAGQHRNDPDWDRIKAAAIAALRRQASASPCRTGPQGLRDP